MTAGRALFGTLPDGAPVERLRLEGAHGFEVAVITYGAAIQSILAPDAQGRLADVVLGHDDLASYRGARAFFGATIGRFANRIAGGRFELAGREVHVAPNDGVNTLHGGASGFDTRLFAVEEASANRIVLTRTSPDGEEGFPGNLSVRVAYEVEGTALTITLGAAGDADTLVNLTNHAYFNLAGSGSALGHELQIAAETFLPVDGGGIPTGEEVSVIGTPFDFRQPRPVDARIREAHPQTRAVRGYDHNFCLAGARTAEPRPVASLRDPQSGRTLVVETTEPGLQFYSGNFLDGGTVGKGGLAYRQGDGLCLEPQAFPDAPNRPRFPSAVLREGEAYRHVIRLRFGNAPASSARTGSFA